MLLSRYVNALIGYFVFSASRATTIFIEDRIAAIQEVRFKYYEEDNEEEEESF